MWGSQSTTLSIGELERSEANEFLWGVAHEARHWTTPVGMDGNRHFGEEWQLLRTRFGIKDGYGGVS